MTGTIVQVVGTKKTFCFIRTPDAKDYFAHKIEFPDPSIMQVGQEVEFRVKLASRGNRPAATDVVAIHRKAA